MTNKAYNLNAANFIFNRFYQQNEFKYYIVHPTRHIFWAQL